MRAKVAIALAVGLGVLGALPAEGAIYERFRFVDEPYTDKLRVCGLDVQVQGTASGHGRVRIGTGARETAFFGQSVVEFSETWTVDGNTVTVTGKSVFNETKATPLGGTLFDFRAIEAGQPFRLYDADGNLVLRDRGAIEFRIVFDTLGDDAPGGVLVDESEPVLRGPHPGFEDETLCPVLLPLLED